MKKTDIYVELAIGWLATITTCVGAYINKSINAYLMALAIVVIMTITTYMGCYIIENIQKNNN